MFMIIQQSVFNKDYSHSSTTTARVILLDVLNNMLYKKSSYLISYEAKRPQMVIILRREVSKNETFWHDSDPWRIFSTSSRGLWASPRALTYIYGIPTSFVVEPACATVTSPQSEV